MEDAGKALQVASSASAGKSKLRYQLRSSTKSDEKSSPKAASLSAATKRARPAPGVSQSMNVIDLSGKEKSAKPPRTRRLSVPNKGSVTPATRRMDSMTPMSEASIKRSAMSQGESDTPSSEVSKPGMSRPYSRISTASYWLSQIKLAETAAKHSISLGFFKLALEAGCEPKQQMRNELKAYAGKHNLEEHGSLVNELFGSYNITEKWEELRGSENTSEVVQGSTKSSDDDVQSVTSSIRSRNLKPKSLDKEVACSSITVKSVSKESFHKKSPATRTIRGSVSSVNLKRTPANTARKNTGEADKPKSEQVKVKISKQTAKTVNEEGNLGSVVEKENENKENTGSTMPVEEIDTVEVL